MSRRDNKDWLDELRGKRGYQRQEEAHEDLAAYLYKVAYNYLLGRQAKANPYILVTFDSQALAALAQDFVQETIEKLARDEFALLDQFKGKARFTSWAAVIARRQAAQELRKSYWERRVSPPQAPSGQDERSEWSSAFELRVAPQDRRPEKATMQREVGDALQDCLRRLKEHQRNALLGSIVEERSGEQLARILKRSPNAVYLLVRRSKSKLGECMVKKGWNREVLEIFK